MKHGKRLLTFVLALVLTIGMTVSVSAASNLGYSPTVKLQSSNVSIYVPVENAYVQVYAVKGASSGKTVGWVKRGEKSIKGLKKGATYRFVALDGKTGKESYLCVWH